MQEDNSQPSELEALPHQESSPGGSTIPDDMWEVKADENRLHTEIEEDDDLYGALNDSTVVIICNHRKWKQGEAEFLLEFSNSVRLWFSTGMADMEAPKLVTTYVTEHKLENSAFETARLKKSREKNKKKNDIDPIFENNMHTEPVKVSYFSVSSKEALKRYLLTYHEMTYELPQIFVTCKHDDPGFYKSEENAAYFGEKWDMNNTRCAKCGTIFVDNMETDGGT